MRRITDCFLWLMLTVYLFGFGSQGYLNITEVKFALYIILCGLYGIAMLVCAIRQRRWASPLQLLRQSSWAQRFVLLFVVLTWLSTLLSPHRSDAILGLSRYEGAVTITLYGFVFMAVSAFGRPSRALLYGCACSVTVFCILCLVQMTGSNPLGLYPQGLSWFDAGKAYSGAYLGTIGNVDLVAAWLSMAIPLLWAALLRLKGRLRWSLLLPLVVALAALLQMQVLAGLMGVFGSVVLSLPVVLPVSRRVRCGIAVGIAGCAVLAAAVLFAFDIGDGFLHELHELLHGRVDERFGSGRLHIWGEVCRLVPDHLWLGAGPDTMLHAELPPFTRYDPDLDRMLVSTIDTAHNEYLNVLYHQGLLGLIAYLGALVCLVWQWLKRRDDVAAAILGAAALGYGIQAFFGISMCITAPYFWIVLGLLDSRRKSDSDLSKKL